MLDDQFHVYDTTLRDGAQQEGLNLTVADKLVIARHLDRLGVGFIEGGWPGAIPKDTEFFRRAATELDLEHAQLAAFGSTRKAGVRAADDSQVAALREQGAGLQDCHLASPSTLWPGHHGNPRRGARARQRWRNGR